jgi:hypothetical protein
MALLDAFASIWLLQITLVALGLASCFIGRQFAARLRRRTVGMLRTGPSEAST